MFGYAPFAAATYVGPSQRNRPVHRGAGVANPTVCALG
jgi:hypothetical protein